MLFPDETLYDQTLFDLSNEIAGSPPTPIDPLPCDRWIARSCLQKAIRRAQPELAVDALAVLFAHDQRSVWRTLAIIACEDVGIANISLLDRIVAAQSDRSWRRSAGGDWKVVAELVRQMALSNHCQAACDLLLQATNDPSRQLQNGSLLELGMGELLTGLTEGDRTTVDHGAIVLSIAGGLATGQQHHDAPAVFDAFVELGISPRVVQTCRAAWRICRNPMALLLPILWHNRPDTHECDVADDPISPAQLIARVPGYAIDQFTRVGNAVSRSLLASSPEITATFTAAGIPEGRWVATIGDLLFISEGGLLCRRVIWPTGDFLRLPHRQLPNLSYLGSHLEQALRFIDAQASQIEKLRVAHLPISRNG